MKRPRRNFLQLAVGAAAVPAIPQFAWAQTYPTRPVRIVVATGAGGAPDILARLIGQWLFERLGQQFVVENRPGGGNNIGTEAVVRAAPDGYTLLLVDPTASINATLYEKSQLQFHPRYRAGRGYCPLAARHGGQSIVSGQDGSRVHRFCQSQSGQNQHGFTRHRDPGPRGR
jgi:tripartite-type tricarboxylate transporter receptor subunit TctC